MGWFRKIVNVLIVVGVAALMSIPFKRVPVQTTSKSGARGEWELDRPSLPFKLGDILTGDERPATSNKPVIPSTEASDAEGRAPAQESSSSAGSPVSSFGNEAAPGSASSGSRNDQEGGASAADSLPVLRDDDRRRPMSTMPRIEGQPAPAEKIEDQAPIPSLPTDFQPLRDS